MTSKEENFFEITDEQFQDEYIVNDLTKFDHWLLFGIGILPFVIVSVWYFITF